MGLNQGDVVKTAYNKTLPFIMTTSGMPSKNSKHILWPYKWAQGRLEYKMLDAIKQVS